MSPGNPLLFVLGVVVLTIALIVGFVPGLLAVLRRSSRPCVRIVGAVVVPLLVVGTVAVSGVFMLWALAPPPSPPPAPWGTVEPASPCSDFAGSQYQRYAITWGTPAPPLTTANLVFILTPAGASAAVPPGAPSAPDNCVRNPTSPSGWVAVLSSSGGTPQAVFGSNGWGAINATLPVTITGGQTLVVVAGAGVNLTQATLELHGVNGASVSGSVTL
ncbi:MAG: hypothetical protein KGJ23_16035 [Euryarchaeota archaeon]|nr:hypothetical protein [Euryarchaeota archaeon]MDE1838108.1 hypothetical protein [Euryarchaeota archaeon]MDE2046714.1 hypothetical protein [Thermoplasmata archaeon]